MKKLGPHCITQTEAALNWSCRAPVVKSLGDPHILRQVGPGSITIFRSYFDPYEQDRMNPDEALGKIFTQLDGFRPTYIELWNEVNQRLGQGLERHADAVYRCVQPIHDYGSKVAGFSFSTGCPELEDWAFLSGWLDPDYRAVPFCGVDAICIHEYWAKQGFSEWNALRHRKVHDWLFGKHPPFIIGECGRDAVWQEGGDKQPGWKLQGVSGEDYATELIAYNTELEKDDYVIGATVFTAGPTADWDNFSTDEISHLIPGGLPDGQEDDMAEDLLARAMIADLKQQTAQLLSQNALLTDCWRRFRQGKWTGAEGIDGAIVALQGGNPNLGFTATYPKE